LALRERLALHGETLLVVASGDANDVSLELIAQRVGGQFGAHALLEERANAALIFDLDELLGPVSGMAQIDLHRGGLRIEMVMKFKCCSQKFARRVRKENIRCVRLPF
jgi:hypothetical protein